MDLTTLTYALEHRTGVVTLNRPDRRNSLDDVMIRELTDVLGQINRSEEVRTVVLTGAGKAFCSGMDLEYLRKFSQLGQAENLEDAHNLLKLLQLIRALRKPVIAMVHGPALGGGCGLAAVCDFVFASSEKASFGAPEVRLGFLPAVIMYFLMKRMGEGRAREFALRGEILTAPAALQAGLVTELVEDRRLHARTLEFAESVARTASPASLSLTKDLICRLDEMPPRDGLEYASNLNALVRKTGDFQRGLDAFLRKESLEW